MGPSMSPAMAITLVVVGFLLVVTPTLIEFGMHTNLSAVLESRNGHPGVLRTTLPDSIAVGLPLFGAACIVYAVGASQRRRGMAAGTDARGE